MSVTILIVDDEEVFRKYAGAFLQGKGYEVKEAAKLQEARNAIQRGDADIVLLDVQLPDGYGPALLEEMANLPMQPPVILITAYGDIEMAVEAMKSGAHDFLQKPIQLAQLEKSIQRAQEIVAMRLELAHLRQAQQKDFDFFVGSNPQVLEVLEQAKRAASAAVPVLITGETGTGKELLARAIHKMATSIQKASDRPFIDINCAAIQSTVLESELFGYEVGAFTGADKRKKGLMEVADGGTLFLDEISSMPLDIQAKLLRAIQEQSFRRVGGTTPIKVSVHIIAASNRDLPAMMAAGEFRPDLYYRLKVVDLELPQLRYRREDIPDLVGLFIRKNNQTLGKNILDITPRALQALLHYDWPGNIRELEHIINRAVLFCDDTVIDLTHLPSDLRKIS